MKITKIGFLLICLIGIFRIMFVFDMYNQNGAKFTLGNDTKSPLNVSEHLSRKSDYFNNNFIERIQLPLVQSVQENSYFCVPACLQMVLNNKDIHKTQYELAMEMNTKPDNGTEYADLARVANTYLFHKESITLSDAGYHIQTLTQYDTNPEISTIFEKRVRLDIGTNDPVFAAIDIHALFPKLSSNNHMIVIIGYEMEHGADNITYYYYVDPSYLVQDETYGGLERVSIEKLIHAIIVNEEPAYIW